MSSSNSVTGPDPKRPYGGLVPSQPKGTRAFQDAASYNQQLAQHQAFTAQAQAANNIYRNPYVAPQQQQQQQGSTTSQTTYTTGQDGAGSATYGPQPPPQQQQQQPPSHGHHQHQYSASQPTNTQLALASASGYTQGGGLGVPGLLHPNAPPSSYFPAAHARARANTINHDAIPPALARLQHMNQDVLAGGRNALTPVLNRDDAMREWERRQAGKPPAQAPYPQLEYLQQQAELAATSGGWHGGARYGAAQPSKLSQSYQPHQPTIVVDDDGRRDAVMSNVRSAARGEPNVAAVTNSASYNSTAMVTSPTQAYAGTAGASGGRYQPSYAAQQASNPTFDGLGGRTDIGSLYVPMQPEQYQSYAAGGPAAATASGSAPTRQATQANHQVPSFYGSGVASAVQSAAAGQQVQQRNPFSNAGDGGPSQGQMSTKDARRLSGMDIWSR